MPMHRLAVAFASLSIVLLSACSGADESAQLPPELVCQAGAWRMDDGSVLSLVPVTDGLRYRLLDGRTGRLEPASADAPTDNLEAREGWRETGPVVAHASFGSCAEGRLRFALDGGPDGTGHRLGLPQHDTHFDSNGLRLRGRLVLPHDATGAVPLAVLVHGSERYSGVDSYPLQYLLPAQGVAVFVYDKRGTGGSQGEYTQDFHALAADAVAALAEARRLHPPGFSRAGYVGTSQGGWIAPLAASESDADYVVALYGMAESALAEDREQVMHELRRKGHGEDVLAKAREVTDATAQLMSSGFTQGFDALREARARHGDEAWFGDIKGEYSGQVLAFPDWAPEWVARAVASRYDVGTSWDYEPLPVLEALAQPQLWVIAAEDLEAPTAETLRRLRALQAAGRPLDLAVFPGTDHGILEFEEREGERTMLRHPQGYFELIADWIRDGRLHGPYGTAELEPGSAGEARSEHATPTTMRAPARMSSAQTATEEIAPSPNPE